MRWTGILGLFAVLAATSVDAGDAERACSDQFEEIDTADSAAARGEPLLLLEDRCDAIKDQELRAPLMLIPQEGEDPMELSFGIKSNGGMLRLKIPFSF